MCMTLAFTLGLSQGYKQTLWMMWGELAGVATVVSTCVLLLAWIQSLSDLYFTMLALAGGGYLLTDCVSAVDASRKVLTGEKRSRA